MSATKNKYGQTRERLRQYRRNGEGFCSVAGCPNRWVKSGYCPEHYEANKTAARERYRERTAR